jgi:hypothetical protein
MYEGQMAARRWKRDGSINWMPLSRAIANLGRNGLHRQPPEELAVRLNS